MTHHSDRDGRYPPTRYAERLGEAGLAPSVGSGGDSCDNAPAETIIGLFKTDAIHGLGPWKSQDAVEWETVKWVDWFNDADFSGRSGTSRQPRPSAFPIKKSQE